MPDKQQTPLPVENHIPVAEIRPARRFSITWLVPIITVLVAGWLVYATLAAKGPTITISFQNAEGLEPEKTKVKYKEVEVGKVKDIAITKDLDGVNVTVELRRGTEQYLTDQTKFWVAKAHVSAKEVRDLGTLLSGAYIGIDPAVGGKPQTEFVGLERPPAISNSRPGRFFVLSSESLGSLSIGSTVLFRQLEVGQVTDYRLKEDRSGVLVDIFVEAPFHELVRENSHFWNSSGIRLNVNTNGVEISTDSLISVFLGGITFDSPLEDAMDPADEGELFQLHPDQNNIKDEFTIKRRLVAYFSDSVRGLSPGASVEFKGLKIGEVEKIIPEIDMVKGTFRVKTILAIEPLKIAPQATPEEIMQITLPALVSRGLRAQLSTESFLTGQLYVDLDFHEQASAEKMLLSDPYPQLPTVTSTISQTTESITRILEKLEQIPMDKIGDEMTRTVDNLNETLTAITATLEGASGLSPALTDTLKQFQVTAEELQQGFDEDSVMQYRLQEMLRELQMTSRSLRTLTDYLERKPQSIIFGKDEEQQ